MNPIFERVSVRRWTEQPVEKEKIMNLLRAGMQAPSAVNSQPWEFVVITEPKLRQQLSQISPYAHFAAEAPVLLALICRKENACPEYNQIDMGICIENILLEAVEQGLGAVCLGVAPEEDRMKKMAALLELPETKDAFALIPVGYPASVPAVKDRFDPARITWIG